MLRNLVLNLPKINTASKHAISSIRKRDLRSLSPVKKAQEKTDGVTESASCSKIEQTNSLNKFTPHQSRTLCYSKEYYAHNNEKIKEIKWREDPSIKTEKEVKEEVEDTLSTGEASQYEILEQYELEAARPRPEKSQELLEKFKQRNTSPFNHLQPDQIKPYGSQENLYSPSLIQPTNAIKYPKRHLRKALQEKKELEALNSVDLDSSRHRNYSTLTGLVKNGNNLSTSPTYITKEASQLIKQGNKEERHLRTATSNKDILIKEIERLSLQRQFPINRHKSKADICPPPLLSYFRRELDETPIKFSTPQMRRDRKVKENLNSNLYYKASYSDLIKLKLKESSKQASNDLISNIGIKNSIGTFNIPITETKKSHQKLLEVSKSVSCHRSITTKLKTDLPSHKVPFYSVDLLPKVSHQKSTDYILNQRNYSKSKNKKSAKSKKKDIGREFNPQCEDICSKKVKKAKPVISRKYIPFEPRNCDDLERKSSIVYLPSKVKLGVPFCTPRPEYRDCKPPKKCPPRADDCLPSDAKPLPKLVAGDCPCIDPEMPKYAPKLEKLNIKFEDPPKVICHPPPCQTPRADDVNPPKFKPLKPYVPGDCECIEPPHMVDVKLKRLPRCQPEEVCRPPRICPVIEPCPPRADECLVIEPKVLPPIKGAPCPCLEPPVPNKSPPMPRLNLHVPEPPRPCLRPPPCKERERADNHLKIQRKKLPKFIPGDCPCEDRHMVDWKLRRLECVDEPKDCIVPDPCKTFPRADWGCWEYNKEECAEVDERCIEKDETCLQPQPKKDPCDKNPCRNKGLLDIRYIPKRKYSNTGYSMKLFQTVKSQKSNDHIKTTTKYKPPVIQVPPSTTKASSNSNNAAIPSRKEKRQSVKSDILRLLSSLNTGGKNEDNLLFKPRADDKVDYASIQKKIASETILFDNKTKANSIRSNVKKSKSVLAIASRAISTSKAISKSEKDIKKEKACVAKKKCKNIKPTIKSLTCKKVCPTLQICSKPGREYRPSCKIERVPVCCEKEESPYPSFSDTVQESIKPYTNTPQFTCNRTQYGFHPNFKKEFDPLDQSKDKKKHFSTSSLTISNVPLHQNRIADGETTNGGLFSSNKRMLNMSPKASMTPAVRSTKTSACNHRSYSTKVFQIKKPIPCPKPTVGKVCDKTTDKKKPPKILCDPPVDECQPNKRPCCPREYVDPNLKRTPAPFPAFSDCLDEEMEDILTECPLDKEKYLRMQPRFMNPPNKPFSLKPPPPIQGKLDLLKEQTCIREKLCMKNEGLTQYCTDFGKPIPLMKSKKMITERNTDCEKIEKLKRIGRWPPFTLKQNRSLCSIASNHSYSVLRNLSTLGLNSIRDIEKNTYPNDGGKRIYVRNYYALVKSIEKAVLAENENDVKEYVQKIFPDLNENSKILRLRNDQWRMENLKKHDKLNEEICMPKRIKRFYTIYKTKHKKILRLAKNKHYKRNLSQNSYFKNFVSFNSKIKLIHKSKGRIDQYSDNCNLKKNKASKFTLSNHNAKTNKKHKKGIMNQSKYPAFAECKEDNWQIEKMKFLQPQYTVLPETSSTSIQEYPSQENVDVTLGMEYYKCRHGLKSEGVTVDCSTFNEYMNNLEKKVPKFFYRKYQDIEGTENKTTDCSTNIECCNSKEDIKACDTINENTHVMKLAPKHTDNRAPYLETFDPQATVEFLVQEHRSHRLRRDNSSSSKYEKKTKEKKTNHLCDEDRKKIENLCMEHCLKNIPCHLPEEEKYRICRDECKEIFNNSNKTEVENCNESVPESKTEQKFVCENHEPKPCKLPKSGDKPDQKTVHCNEPTINQPPPKKCEKFEFKCPPKPTAVICRPKIPKSKSFSQIETFFQKVVNYFKARPNCPAPGDWKKKALRDKAEKAATAAGLVVIDPKCVPENIIKSAKVSKKACKSCPETSTNCDKREVESENKKSSCQTSSPKLTGRTFSTRIQPSRNYSSSLSYKNLEEINKIIEEEEMKKKELKIKELRHNFKREFGVAVERKDSGLLEALEMSVNLELNKPVQLSNLYCKNKPYPKTYFGYSDILPSRENILEKAWRMSIEAYTRNNAPKSFEFFNDFFTKVENSIQSIEDLEKLKTENVLRELEEFLKNNSKKNKK